LKDRGDVAAAAHIPKALLIPCPLSKEGRGE
jgi:hypothetical protein